MHGEHILGVMLVAIMIASTMLPLAGASSEGTIELSSDIPDPAPAVSISWDVDGLDFGIMRPGEISDAVPMTVANEGSRAVALTATVEDAEGSLFSDGLYLDGRGWSSYSSPLAVEGSKELDISLRIPDDAVTGSFGGSLTVWAEALPDVDFYAEVVEGASPLAVQFTDLSANSPTSWAWDFDGDGTVDSTERNPSCTYLLEGAYNVSLTVTDADGTGHMIKDGYVHAYAWSGFLGNQQLPGYYAGDAPDTNRSLWVSEDIQCVPSSSVAIGEGKVFVYCFDLGATSGYKQGYIAALDLKTGDLLWKKETILTNKWGSWATPTYHDGLVFTSGDTARYASNGTPAWPEGRYLADGTNGGPLVVDGKVIQSEWETDVPGRPGGYYCYDEKTGKQLWYFSDKRSTYYQGTPSYHDGKLYLTSWISYSGVLHCVDANSGREIWSVASESGQCFCGSVSIAYGYLYLTSYNFYGDGKAYCFYESNGTLKWSQTVQRTDSTPAVYDGMVYISSGCYQYSPRQIFCLDAYTGKVVWSTDVAENIGGWTSSPAVADGKLFVGVEGKGSNGDQMVFGYVQIIALDLKTGEPVWTSKDPCGSSVAVYNGAAFSTGTDGKVYAYGSFTGHSAIRV